MEFQTHSYHFLLMALSGLLAVTLSAHTHTSKGDYRQLLEFQSGQSGQFSQCHLNNKHSSVFKEKSRRWGVRNEEEFEREKVMLAIVIQDVCVRVRSGGSLGELQVECVHVHIWPEVDCILCTSCSEFRSL